MGATNHQARALALNAARKYFDGLHVRPSGDTKKDAPYWKAIKNVRKELRAVGYTPCLVHSASVYALSALRKERARQEATP